jgi:hypothetical protein
LPASLRLLVRRLRVPTVSTVRELVAASPLVAAAVLVVVVLVVVPVVAVLGAE